MHTTTPTFHHFTRLPFELRSLIWEMTIEPRTVKIGTKRTPTSGYAQYSPTPAPALLRTCCEARQIGLKTYEKSFQKVLPEGSGQYIWINFSLDTIFLPQDTGFHNIVSVAPFIKHLKIERENSCTWHGEYFYHSESHELRTFENVEDVHVICVDGLRAWRGATEEHWFPCGAENVWLIGVDAEVGQDMSALELDEMCEREQEESLKREEELQATGVSAEEAAVLH